jgi:GDP-L-fucose synthase
MNKNTSILITGGNGLIGKGLNNFLKEKGYKNIFSLDKDELDVGCSDKVDDFFNKNHPDIVFHLAVSGGRRFDDDNPVICYNNLLGFENIFNCFQKYKTQDTLLFNFTSGAEFDRRFDILNINDMQEFTSIPIDTYGLSKYLITQRLRALKPKSVITFRLFNVFGITEEENRFISTCIKNTINNETIKIFEDKKFTFFYIEDLFRLIEYLIYNKENDYKEINCSYNKDVMLSDVANYIVTKMQGSNKIEITQNGTHYSAKSDFIDNIKDKLDLIGLYGGIDRMVYDRSISK